jgi:hypothetical protein
LALYDKKMGNAASQRENDENDSMDSAELQAQVDAAKKKPKIKTRHDVVFVDDDEEEIEQSVGFSPSMFIGKEFDTLKKFCNKRGVHQRHLNFLFKKYLSGDDIYLREFRVNAFDLKDQFDSHSKVLRELSEIFFPMIYQRELGGLKKPQSLSEVTFPRFVIITYIFCAQPIPDLILELFAILRQRFNLKLDATIHAYNLEQMVSLFAEHLKSSATLEYMLQMFRKVRKDSEFTIGEVIRIAIKYPLSFYVLKSFQKHVRRMFLGDKFWANQKKLKTKCGELELPKKYDELFANEDFATLTTVKAMINDIFDLPLGKAVINLETKQDKLAELDENVCNQLKKSIGYNMAHRLIKDSQLPFPTEGQYWLNGKILHAVEDEKYEDTLSGEYLVYNASSGKRAWVVRYAHYDSGDILKEIEIEEEPMWPDSDSDDETYDSDGY